MAAPARNLATPSTKFEQLRLAREVLDTEAAAIKRASEHIGIEFADVLDLIAACQGHVVLIGMGKCNYIAQKISATLASTGCPSYFLHPAEAIHGDLGRLREGDVALVLSFSGKTAEIVDILPAIRSLGVTIVALTGNESSPLAIESDHCLLVDVPQEACPLNLAPSASTTAMLALGDALALVASQQKNFQPADFARFHPGGSLGQRLATVEQCMRSLDACRLAEQNETVRAVLVRQSGSGRRTGAMMVTDTDGKLVGVFTDSDLSRLLESRRDDLIDGPLSAVMTATPRHAIVGWRMPRAIALLSEHKLSELPVVNDDGEPVGMIDITDVVGFPSSPSPVSIPFQTEEARTESDAGS